MNAIIFIERIGHRCREFIAYLQLREAVRSADKAHRKTGKRYYVMPSTGGKLLVIDRSNFRILKRKGYISHKIMVNDMIMASFYFTPHRDGSGWITESVRKHKVIRYFTWYFSELTAAKRRKKIAKERKKEGKKNVAVQRKK